MIYMVKCYSCKIDFNCKRNDCMVLNHNNKYPICTCYKCYLKTKTILNTNESDNHIESFDVRCVYEWNKLGCWVDSKDEIETLALIYQL